MEREYLNDLEQRSIKARTKGEWAKKKGPLTADEMMAQMRRNHEAAMAAGSGDPHLRICDGKD